MDDWISELKEGDKVIVSSGGAFSHQRIVPVKRLTKTQVILIGLHGKYRRDTGWQIGDCGYYRRVLIKPTEERIISIRRAEAIRELEQTKWDDFPTDFIFELKARIAGERLI